jgi:transposase
MALLEPLTTIAQKSWEQKNEPFSPRQGLMRQSTPEERAMNQSDLFGVVPEAKSAEKAEPKKPVEGNPRLMRPDRHQMRFVPTDLDALLEENHPARAIWEVVETLDLSKFEDAITARGDHPGRPAVDPRILATLWLYAISEGEDSAREIERLCEAHSAYRWIAGGVHVNHHTLSDFRVGHQEALNELFTQVLGVLNHQGLVDLTRTAQDGMRVRASAGAASFRREKSLKECLEEAKRQVDEVARQAQEKGAESAPRRAAARQRAARERKERVQKALLELPQAQEAKTTPEKKAQARVSTTDPEARVMKMADGGFRPAYNVQLATDTKTRVIVGVDVTNLGSDQGEAPAMLENIKERNGELPAEHLVDGGFAEKASIEKAAQQGVTIYAPVQKPKKEGVDPHQPKPGDSPEVAAWRKRMGTPEAKEVYKERAATAETTNADLRTHRGLNRFLVRTIPKVKCVVLWAALTYNILKLITTM